jgi:formylglycine-generating enzyme required for sulfatase activity
MVRFVSTLATAALALIAMPTLGGCSRGGNAVEQPASANAVRAEDLVGKWRLVRAGGQPPAELWIRSCEIDIAAEGTWTSKTVVKDPAHPAADAWNARGTWALADGVLRYNDQASPTSQVRLESGRLVVDPDYFMPIRKRRTSATASEYERPAPPDTGDKEDLIAAMKFVKIPRGTFWMGWDSDKKQSRQVEIKQDFELAAYTVTQGQWQELMGNNPSEFSRHGRNRGMVPYDEADLRRFPVENVSWNDVQTFLKKLNEREKGKGWLYRLPREAEWEYACRGAATSKEECSFDFYLDRPTNELSLKFANFGNHNVTVKVGSYPPNKLGLYDMHGNVQQWCEDLAFPQNPKATARVTRGGNWGWDSKACRAAARCPMSPSHGLNYCGFRVARVAAGGT